MNSCLSECWRHVYFLESITVQWFTSICFYLHSHWLQFYHLTWLCSLIGGDVYPRKPPALRVTPWYKADGVVLPGEESSEWFVCFLKINLSLLTDQVLSSRIDVSRCHHGEQSGSHPTFGWTNSRTFELQRKFPTSYKIFQQKFRFFKLHYK